MESQIKKTGLNLKVSMPILFNIPVYSKFQYTNEIIKMTTCEEVRTLQMKFNKKEKDKFKQIFQNFQFFHIFKKF